MVSLFSFFSSKKRPKATDQRPTSPTSPKRVRSVRTPSKPSSSAQFKAEAARRASSEGHGLASKRLKAAAAGATLSCTTATANASSAGLARSPSGPAPPRINISLPFEARASNDEINASLGLDGVGRTPTLSAAERRVLDAQRYTPGDLQAVWEWLGPEFSARGAETVGIMLPRRLETSKDRQRQLASLFVLARRPQLGDKFPSLTSRYPTVPQDQAAEEWKSRLVAVAKDTPNPVDLAEVLKTILRRLSGNARPIIDPATYVRFVQQEHAASYPRVAYANMLVPHLSEDVVGLLSALFEVVSAVALHAELNSMSAGRLCHLFGWWLLGAMPDGTTSWSDLYEAYRLAGQRAEHLFYSRVRWQTTQQKMPRRLVQLILSYPFGESSASSEHLPLPPASTFPRRVLHVTLGTDSALPTGTDPDKVLSDALIAKLDEDVTAPAWLSIRGEDNAVTLDTVLSTNSREFLAELATAKGLDFTTPPATPTHLPSDADFHYHPFESSLNGRRRSMSCEIPRVEAGSGAASSDTHGVGASPGSGSRRVVRQSSAINLSPSRASPVTPPQWDDFLQSGFGETSNGVRELSLSLTKPTTPLRLSTGSGASGSPRLQVPNKRVISESKTTTIYVISSEEIVEMDDGFIHFVEDGQLDPVASSSWPRFALVQLAQPVQTASGPESVDWLLVTVKKREAKRLPSLDEPMPDLRSPDPLRPLSPSTGETSHSRFSTAFGFGSLANKFRRKSYFAELASHTSPPRSRSLQPITYKKRESRHMSKSSGASDTPTEYTLGEMGEIVKIPSLPNSPPTSPPPVQMDPVLSRTSPSDWVYLGEGGAHVIFRYRGSDPALQGHAMRLVKATDAGTPGVALRHTWAGELLPQLVPANLLAQPKSVHLNEQWTRAIVTPTELMRPADRRSDGKTLAEIVDYTRPGQLMDDLTCGVAGEKVLAIEIKPKWGFLPQAQHLTPPESIPVKTRNCRYCLHQHYRGENVEGAATFCPLDLYSGDRMRVRHALEGLWEVWHHSDGGKNNLRVFVDGKKVLPASAELIPTTRQGRLSDGTSDFLVPLLEQSGALQQLKQLQSTLDATNISDLAKQFTAKHPGVQPFSSDIISEPTAAELTSFVKLYQADREAGGRSNSWNLREREIAFGLSAIFKDCSLIVRAVLRPSNGSYELDGAKSSVKMIDTDLKPLSNLRKWYELDEKLWRHWMATRGSEEPTIVIPAEPKDSSHHSYHNLTKAAGAGAIGLAAAAAAGGVYASPMPPSPNPDNMSSRQSIASIDDANTALARTFPDSSTPPSDAQATATPEPALEQVNPAQLEPKRDEPELNTSERVDSSNVVSIPAEPTESIVKASEPDVPSTESIVPESEPIVPSTESIVPAEALASPDLPTSEAGPVVEKQEPAVDDSPVTPEPTAAVEEVAEHRSVEASDVPEVARPTPTAPTEAAREVPVEADVAAEVAAESTPETPGELAVEPTAAVEHVPAVEPVLDSVSPPVETEVATSVESKETPTELDIPQEAKLEKPSSSTDKKAGFAALAATGVAGAGATAAVVATPKKDAVTSGGTFGTSVTPSPSGGSLAADSPTLRRKTSDLEGKSRVARISSLFNRRASASSKDVPGPKVSPTKTLKPISPPPKRDEGFAARFRKPKKSGGVTPTTASSSAATAAVVTAKDGKPERAVETKPETKAAVEEPAAEAKPEHTPVSAAEAESAPSAAEAPVNPAFEDAPEPVVVIEADLPAAEAEVAPADEPEVASEPVAEPEVNASAHVEDATAPVEASELATADDTEPPAETDAMATDAQAAADHDESTPRDLSASPHTPAMPIRDNFSSVEATPSSPYTPARLGRQTSLTIAPSQFPRLSAFGDDLRIASPDLLNLNQSPSPDFGEATTIPTKSLESPIESPLRKADTAFPRLSAFIDQDAPGMDELRQLGEAEAPTPIKEESRSLQPSPAVATFADSNAGQIKPPPLDAFGITPAMPDAAEIDNLVVPAAAAFSALAGTASTDGYDSESSSLRPVSESRQKRSTAPSPSPHLPSTSESVGAELSHVEEHAELSHVEEHAELSHVEEHAEPEHELEQEAAADESQLLAEGTIDLSSPAKVGAGVLAPAPEHVELYSHAALPPLPTKTSTIDDLPTLPKSMGDLSHLPKSSSMAMTDTDMESIVGSDAFATAPVSPFVSEPVTPIVSVFDLEDGDHTRTDNEPSAHLTLRKVSEEDAPPTPIAPSTPKPEPTTPRLAAADARTPTRAPVSDSLGESS